jgi:hypothetical protein
MATIGKEASAAIARLHRFDVRRPTLDRAGVETAMRAHIAALGLAERPIVWVPDAAAGYKHALAAAWDAAWAEQAQKELFGEFAPPQMTPEEYMHLRVRT